MPSPELDIISVLNIACLLTEVKNKQNPLFHHMGELGVQL